MKRAPLIFFLGFVMVGLAQNKSLTDLQRMEDESLLEYFNKVSEDSIMAEKVARVYLERARLQEDTIKMARGYDRLARIFHPKKNLMYADSIIALTQDKSHITYPGLGFLIKAHWYDKLGDLVLSTKYSYLAYNEAKKNNNLVQQLFLLHYLTNNYAIWGNAGKALELQKIRHEIVVGEEIKRNIIASTRAGAKTDVDTLYITSLLPSFETFTSCYIKLNKIDSARIYLKKIDSLNKVYQGFKNHKYAANYLMFEIEIALARMNHSKALLLIKSYKKHREFSNFNRSQIMRVEGLSLIRTNNTYEGIVLLEKLDSMIESRQIPIIPEHIEVYEELLSYYKSINGTEKKQIILLSKIIDIDSVLKLNYQFFEPSLLKNFETPRLIEEKEYLISSLKEKNRQSKFRLSAYIIVAISLSIGLCYFIYEQRIYKKRYLTLVEAKNSLGISPPSYKRNKEKLISDNTIREILESLEKFEIKQKFLRTDVNLHNLAKSFGTNPKYLSRVVNLKKDTNFPQYLNNLRAEYAAQALKNQKQLRKYSLKAIAHECGFKTAESFTRAFYKRHGIKPTYYLKQLDKEKNDAT